MRVGREIRMANNGIALKEWGRNFTFWKWILSLAFFTGVNVTVMQMHIANPVVHTSLDDKAVLLSIERKGFTFSDVEKLTLLTRVTKVEEAIVRIDKLLEMYEGQGRFQTPQEKRELIEDVIRQYNGSKK